MPPYRLGFIVHQAIEGRKPTPEIYRTRGINGRWPGTNGCHESSDLSDT